MSDNIEPSSNPDGQELRETDWRATVKRLGAVGPLAVLAMLLPWIGIVTMVAFAPAAADWLRSYGPRGPYLFAAGFALLGAIAIMPTQAGTIMSGYIFGFRSGSVAAIFGFVGAALIAYAIARCASGDRAQRVIAEHPKWQAVYDELLHGGFWRTLGMVLLIRFPSSPFAITNLVLAATKVNLVVYTVGTLVGMAPRIMVMAYVGSTFSDLDNTGLPFWMKIVGVVLTFVAFGVIALLGNRAIEHVTGRGDNADRNDAKSQTR